VAFDLDALREANELWSFTTRGHTYRALPVSPEQVMEYQHRLAKSANNPAAITRVHRWFFRQAFPWRPSMIWLGDPVDLILATRPSERQELFKSFFVSLAAMELPNDASPTNGTP
jgi:hypothetical protein